VITILTNQHIVLTYLFTQTCPLAQQLQEVIDVLHQNSNIIAETPNFKWTIAAELLWQVTRTSQQFFNHATTPEDLQVNRRPAGTLSDIAKNLLCGYLTPAFNKPSFYIQPRKNKDQQPPHHKRTRDDRDRPTANQPRTAPNTKLLPTKCGALVSAFKTSNPDSFLPPMRNMRTALGVHTDHDISKHLGIPPQACLRYQVYGECTNTRCGRLHDNATKPAPDKHAALLAKALSRGA